MLFKALADTAFQISIHSYACYSFTSLSSQKDVTEYARATPSFHGHARFDTVLVKRPDGFHQFVELLCLFSTSAVGSDFRLALVFPFRTIENPLNSRTGMRLLEKESNSTFIKLEWIVRRVFICKDWGSVHDSDERQLYWVNDLIANDADMYLRLKSVQHCL